MRELSSAGMQPPVCFSRTTQHPFEGLTKIRAPAVNDGIEGRVGIAQPVEEYKELVWYKTSIKDFDYIDQEKR